MAAFAGKPLPDFGNAGGICATPDGLNYTAAGCAWLKINNSHWDSWSTMFWDETSWAPDIHKKYAIQNVLVWDLHCRTLCDACMQPVVMVKTLSRAREERGCVLHPQASIEVFFLRSGEVSKKIAPCLVETQKQKQEIVPFPTKLMKV